MQSLKNAFYTTRCREEQRADLYTEGVWLMFKEILKICCRNKIKQPPSCKKYIALFTLEN